MTIPNGADESAKKSQMLGCRAFAGSKLIQTGWFPSPGLPDNTRRSFTRNAVLVSVLVLLYSDVFSGVIRWSFHALGATFLSYSPMLLCAMTSALFILRHVRRSQFDNRICIVALCLSLSAGYAILMGRSPF